MSKYSRRFKITLFLQINMNSNTDIHTDISTHGTQNMVLLSLVSDHAHRGFKAVSSCWYACCCSACVFCKRLINSISILSIFATRTQLPFVCSTHCQPSRREHPSLRPLSAASFFRFIWPFNFSFFNFSFASACSYVEFPHLVFFSISPSLKTFWLSSP